MKHIWILIAACFCAVLANATERTWEKPTDCQAKTAYLQYLISSRDQGIEESQLIDYDRQLDAGWKKEMQGRVFEHGDFLTENLAQTMWRFYSQCTAGQQPR